MAIKLDPKRPGLWYARYGKRDSNTGKVHQLTRTGFVSQAEAKRAMPALIVAVHEKIKRSQVPTWSKVLEKLPERSRERGLTEKTITDYMLCLNAHTLEGWGDRTVDTITPAEIRNLINTKLADKSVNHQKNMLKKIRVAFESAVEAGELKVNPSPKMAFRIGDKVKAVLTAEQARRFLNAAKELNHPWYPVWCTAIYTGMRSGELYALKWENVDLNQKKILVCESWNNIDGTKCTKNGSDRLVAIAPPLLHILKELKLVTGHTGFVLPRFPAWKKGFQAKVLRMFLKGIGLPTVRFHDLRASFATILLSNGVPPAQVMSMGGWADMKTMLIYMRKAGIDILGATDSLLLHDPAGQLAKVIDFERAL